MFTFRSLALFLWMCAHVQLSILAILMIHGRGGLRWPKRVSSVHVALLGGQLLLASRVQRPAVAAYWRLGGRCTDRFYHTDHADEFDVTNLGFFINSSLAPVLRFRRGFKSVCNVFKGINTNGFTDARTNALWDRWAGCHADGANWSQYVLRALD